MAQVRLDLASTIELEDLDELSDEESQALEEDVRQILDSEGANMMSLAQGIVPVRTGNLLNSIFYETDNESLEIILGATAEYASFVEYGTYKMTARPFLEPAAEAGQEAMNVRIEQAVVDRLDGRLDSPEAGDLVTMEIESVKQTSVEL